MEKIINYIGKKIIVDGCYQCCPFYGSTMDGMECRHLFWDDKDPYAKSIITQDNSRDGKIPEACPLRKESLTITTEYSLKE